jgi:hypothetical protein
LGTVKARHRTANNCHHSLPMPKFQEVGRDADISQEEQAEDGC